MSAKTLTPKDLVRPITLPFEREIRNQIQAYLDSKGAPSPCYASSSRPVAMDYASALPDTPMLPLVSTGGDVSNMQSSTKLAINNGHNNTSNSVSVPFTNQLAYQDMFTPAEWSFENPFAPQQSEASGSRPVSVSQTEQQTAVREEKKSAQSIYDMFVNPPVHLATGDRFLQLLEQKMNLQQQPQPSQTVSNSNVLDPSLQAPFSFALDHQQYDSLAVENALHDLTQVEIPPDLVAPLPPNMYSGWGDWGSGLEMLQQTNEREAPGTEGMQIPWAVGTNGTLPGVMPVPSISTLQHISSAAPAANNLPFKGLSPWISVPPPLHPDRASISRSAPLPTPTFIAPPPPATSTGSLPPILKIRVHDTQSPHGSRSPGLSQKRRAPALSATPNGSWAYEMFNSQSSFPDPGIWGKPIIPSPNTPVTNNTSYPGASSSSLSTNVPPPVTSDTKRGDTSDRSHVARPKKRRADDTGENGNPAAASNDGDGEEKKVIIACRMCRARKLRCDEVRPKCHHCSKRNEEECVYDTVVRRRGPGKKSKRDKERERQQRQQRQQQQQQEEQQEARKPDKSAGGFSDDCSPQSASMNTSGKACGRGRPSGRRAVNAAANDPAKVASSERAESASSDPA